MAANNKGHSYIVGPRVNIAPGIYQEIGDCSREGCKVRRVREFRTRTGDAVAVFYFIGLQPVADTPVCTGTTEKKIDKVAKTHCWKEVSAKREGEFIVFTERCLREGCKAKRIRRVKKKKSVPHIDGYMLEGDETLLTVTPPCTSGRVVKIK